MGKYMRKAKITADVEVMEVSQSTLGVRTRAKTLALQRLQSSSPSPASSNLPDSSCYLQLRSRRLEKPSLLRPQPQKPIPRIETCRPEPETTPNPSSISRLRVSNSVHSTSLRSSPITPNKQLEGFLVGSRVAEEIGLDLDLGVEASFGENNLDFESRERSTRESTPCSLIRDVDVATPRSSTMQNTVNVVNQRSRSAILKNIPSAAEMEEFFARVDQQQQLQFIEKYNFDVVNDMPLPGCYEWVRVNH